MPYRIDISSPPDDAIDRLVQLGALDIDVVNGKIAAIIPDSVSADVVARALAMTDVAVSPATSRDDGSVWLLTPRAVHVGRLSIVPLGAFAPPDALRLTDSTSFGSGHHPTTALCLEALQGILNLAVPERMLDVGTGSGVLALAALLMGVPKATGIDIDADALKVASHHAQINNLSDRLQLIPGGPDVVQGTWPLVVANVLGAPLIEMAPVLVRRLGSASWLILSGIAVSMEPEVRRTYQRLGMRHIRSETRAGWSMVAAQSSW